MKLPATVQQPVGQYALGNIPQPNHAAKGQAAASLIGAVGKFGTQMYNESLVGDIDAATGDAAAEITELRAKLVDQNTLSLDEVPDGIEAAFEISVSDGKGGREGTESPTVFTHEVAEKMWDQGTAEIIDNYAATIKNKKARAKFVEEMQTRYVNPGTLDVSRANVARSRAYGQARAERAMEGILSSNAPSEVREQQIKEVIARQVLLGADPTWAEKQLQSVGPTIDQHDVHNRVLGAGSVDQIDQIEETMWTDGNRMSPTQMRTMSAQMDSRRRDFKAEDDIRQKNNADGMFRAYHDPDTPLSTMDVADAVSSQQISLSDGWAFTNGMKGGSTTKASDQWTLSRYRGEIFKLQYTGGEGNLRVTDKAKLLKLIIGRGSMGLTPQGTTTGQPATVSGTDANILNKEIDAAVKLATENEEYKNAFQSVLMWTRSKLDLEGQIVTAFGGNQDQVEAAVAFKRGLDNYMNTYGADAKPVDYFEANKDAYDPRKFSSGVNGSYLQRWPSVKPFMTQVTTKEFEFSPEQQENYIMWMADNIETLGPERYRQMSAMFDQYYRGRGIAPDNGALMLEPDDPLYRQFQQMIPDNE